MAASDDLIQRFQPALDDIRERAALRDGLLDRTHYQILVATLWSQLVLRPAAAGLSEADLEPVHDLLNAELLQDLGSGHDLRSCFGFLVSPAGESAMQEARLTPEHKDLLRYFASMILDPDGHRRWMDRVREQSPD